MAISGVEPPPALLIEPDGAGLQLRVSREPLAPLGGTRFNLKVEGSVDLATWAAKGDLTTDEGQGLHLAVGTGGENQFFRVRRELVETGVEPTGAELFGYDRAFQEELRAVGFLTPEAFAAEHQPSPKYLAGISFDPTTAQFWNAFNADTNIVNQGLPADSPDRRLYDFRLNPAELSIFMTNGFVVSERLGSISFADVFYRVFSDDLPVFVSADAILHAWHFSYQRLLEEAEETQLAIALQEILDGMHTTLAGLPAPVREGPLAASVRDADYFLAVARSLLAGQQVPAVMGDDASVTNTLAAVAKLEFVSDFDLFGSKRIFDFSQFTVRGHYERTERLARYFRAFMWTARADLRVFAAEPNDQTVRELGTAVVLSHLLRAAGQVERWRGLDDLIRVFVGRADAMTFGQLQPLLDAAGLQSPESITSLEVLKELQRKVGEGTLGLQTIAGDAYFSPCGPDQYQLPRAFVLTGQRFNPDGWALGKVIFDRIAWNQEIPGYTFFGKVIRRHPSALDMAYSVLGNEWAGWEAAQRMLDTTKRSNFRDGLPYAHNLTALARTFNRIPPGAWEESIYTRWLAALRELSTSDVVNDPRYPEAMRTQAWAKRLLNTELASYTELKHDTVLYAKQPYTGLITCEYPAGFVEPVPGFWHKMQVMAESTATNLARLPVSGVFHHFDQNPPYLDLWIDLSSQQTARVLFCQNFARQMAQLEALARRELYQEPFLEDETAFIRGLMNRRDRPYYGATYDGWYPGLFYKDYGQLPDAEDNHRSNKPDQIVTDVHTAPPDDVDGTGGVLHEATGNVDLLMIAVDNGPDRMVYAGPVLSHYEFIVPGPTMKRLSDSEWQARFPWFGTPIEGPPARPEWTRSYLVPK
ncbi:MAG: DUF3160 domain-containing protein [Verrucomicrobiota bacterium]